MTTNAGTISVVVALVSYKRADELGRTLKLLLEQIAAVEFPARILVVDNDAAESAKPTVSRFDGAAVSYVCEPTPGIAAARNRALDESSDDEILIFIDDDETPRSEWLFELVDTYKTHRSAAVVGPVISEFDAEPEPWITEGGFFERRRLPSGTVVEAAASNNLLLDLAQIDKFGIRFDVKFGLSGGSDTLFSRTLSAVGGRIVWCDEAVVVDHVPVSRLTRRWVLMRAMRYGNSWSRTSLAMAPSPMQKLLARALMSARGIIRIGYGTLRVAVGLASRSVRHQARGQRTVMKGVGYLMGAWGGTYVEYARKAEKQTVPAAA